jgi:pimeloyl-ACP methyl ester carboxylesterase
MTASLCSRLLRTFRAWSLPTLLAVFHAGNVGAAPSSPSLPPQGPAGWETAHGWVMGGVSDKSAPVVLFVHGLVSSTTNFKAPFLAWNLKDIDFDPKATAVVNGAVGVALSPKSPRRNWFDELGRTFRVASWDQVPCIAAATGIPSATCQASDTFDAAYQSAPWALRKLLDETTGPIAIIGHSRGGLIGRRLLKEFGNAGGRIKWFVTLHSPNRGVTFMGKAAALDDTGMAFLKALPEDVVGPISAARNAVSALNGAAGAEELAPTGAKSVIPKLQAGETQVPGIAYLSFGGNSTVVLHVYAKGPAAGTNCGAGKEYDAGLCYDKCPAGKKGVGPVCWETCPPGFTDSGVGCTKPEPYGRGAGYPWKFGDAVDDKGMYQRCEKANGAGNCEKDGAIVYPKCKVGYHQVGCCICTPDCPGGMSDTGATCLKRTSTRAGTSPTAVFDILSLKSFPELTNGTGDLMVTDASARLPWPGARHITQPLHHGEVLWDAGTMEKVRAFLR